MHLFVREFRIDYSASRFTRSSRYPDLANAFNYLFSFCNLYLSRYHGNCLLFSREKGFAGNRAVADGQNNVTIKMISIFIDKHVVLVYRMFPMRASEEQQNINIATLHWPLFHCS